MLGIEIDVSSQLGQNEIPVWFGRFAKEMALSALLILI